MQNIKNLETEKDLLKYVLEQIEKIVLQTQYITDTIDKLGKTTGGGCTDEEVCREKVAALRDIVISRETTNQQILKFYEKMYENWQKEKLI